MREVTALLFEDIDDQGQVVTVQEEKDVDVRAYMEFVIGENRNPYYKLQDEPDMPQFLMYGIKDAPRPFAIIIDNKGKFKHLPANRIVLNRTGKDILAGKFLVVVVEGDKPEDVYPDSLTEEEIKLVREHFSTSQRTQEERDELRNYEYWLDLDM